MQPELFLEQGWRRSPYCTMNRDVFSRDCQRDMLQPYTRSRYYHLYLNGLYWGIYQTQERAEESFAESYFGGDEEDYDVIKVNIGDDFNNYGIEATNGNTDAWQRIWEMCLQGFAVNANYYKLIGSNSFGEADTSLTVWVDIDNLIDYMLIIFIPGILTRRYPSSQATTTRIISMPYTTETKSGKDLNFSNTIQNTPSLPIRSAPGLALMKTG